MKDNHHRMNNLHTNVTLAHTI